jgi:hypothetical protein
MSESQKNLLYPFRPKEDIWIYGKEPTEPSTIGKICVSRQAKEPKADALGNMVAESNLHAQNLVNEKAVERQAIVKNVPILI